MSIKNCFNKASQTYDQNCQLQIEVGTKLLSLISSAETVIDLGCGTGIITSLLKWKKLYALDFSANMLSIARSRLGNNNVLYLEASFDDINNIEVDLAFANMSLQWSPDLNFTLNNIKNILKPEGVLAFSLPLAGTFNNLNIRAMEFISFKEIETLLKDWQIIHAFSEELEFIFPNLITGLKSIKAVGANYCTGKKKIIISRENKPKSFKYHIGYFVVRKK